MNAQRTWAPGLPTWATPASSSVAFNTRSAQPALGLAASLSVGAIMLCAICILLARSGRRGAEHMRAAHERKRAYGDEAILAEQQLSLLGLHV